MVEFKETVARLNDKISGVEQENRRLDERNTSVMKRFEDIKEILSSMDEEENS